MLDRYYNFYLPLFIITGILSAEDAELTLRAAIDSALEHNLDLRIATYAPVDALDSVAIEEAQFDLSLFASASLQERKSAARSAIDDPVVPESETAARERVLISVFQPVRPLP